MKAINHNIRRNIANLIIAICGAVFLSSCMNANTTMIQRKYVRKRDDCRVFAERTMASQGQGLASNQQDNNAILAKVFSECMFKRGWAVASPKVAKGPATIPGSPGFPLDQTGSTAAAPAAHSAQPVPAARRAAPLPPPTYDPARKAINPKASYQPTAPVQQPYNNTMPPAYNSPPVQQVAPIQRSVTPPAPRVEPQSNPQADIPVYLMDLQL